MERKDKGGPSPPLSPSIEIVWRATVRVPVRHQHLPALLALLALLIAFLPAVRPAQAAQTLTVTTANDVDGTTCDATCSLRQAIQAANAIDPGEGTVDIRFAIPAGTPTGLGYSTWTINLGSTLPALTRGNITIDGTTTAAGKTVPTIELAGNGNVFSGGIRITSANNTVRGIIASGFKESGASDGAGIVISGSGATNNTVAYCYLGTNVTGTAASATPNTFAGLVISEGASDNVVANSVISGNAQIGVYIANQFGTTPTRNNTVRDSIIGLDADGNVAVRNVQDGVSIGRYANANTIGPNNIISGNGSLGAANQRFGVRISSGSQTTGIPNGNRVIGNRIGTNAAGTAPIKNTGSVASQGSAGIGVGGSANTTIGGPGAGDGNLISGNEPYGIIAYDVNNVGITGLTITNNIIGPDASGGLLAGTTQQVGVVLWRGASNVVVGPGNTIAGNQLDGVQITTGVGTTAGPPPSGNVVKGNRVGVRPPPFNNATLGNGRYGVRIVGNVAASTIGGGAGDLNYISGNSSAGVSIESGTGGAPSGTSVSNNTIGKLPDGALVGNGSIGLQLVAGTSNVVGPGNIISGPGAPVNAGIVGVLIQNAGTSSNIIKGNTISGSNIGVQITSGATANTVGGLMEGEGNTISENPATTVGNNGGFGIRIDGSGSDNNQVLGNDVTGNGSAGVVVDGAVGNRISATTTSDNGGAGIQLSNGGNLGVTFTLAGVTPTSTNVSGNLSGCTGGNCTVEVFGGDSPLTDEGPVFLGRATGVSGGFNVPISPCRPHLIFTVTTSTGNTSAFFNPATVTCPAVSPPQPDLKPDTTTTKQGRPGTSVEFPYTLRNIGGSAGNFSLGVTQTNGWTGATIATSRPLTNLAPDATVAVTLTVPIPSDATPNESSTAVLTASASGGTDQVLAVTTALTAPSLTLSRDTPSPQETGPGIPALFQFTITNTGNGPDSFTMSATVPAGWSRTITPATTDTVPQGETASFTVSVTPPVGATSGAFDVTVCSTSDATVCQTVTGTQVTIVTSAVPQIAPVIATADPGELATFTHTLTNTGAAAASFTLEVGGPAGVEITPPASPTAEVAPGATVEFTFQARTTSATALAGDYPIIVKATAADARAFSTTVEDKLRINRLPSLTIGPDQTDPTPRSPNTTVSYDLTVTNDGNFAETVELSASSSRGWAVSVPETIPNLGAGESQQITVQLTIPPGVTVSPANTTLVTATYETAFDAPVEPVAQIITSIAAVPGVQFVPDTLSLNTDVGQPRTFLFTLQNSGSIPQSFTLDAPVAAPAGWTASLDASSTPELAPGETATIELTFTPDAGAVEGDSGTATFTASSTAPAGASASATANLIIGSAFDVFFSPDRDIPAAPGATVVYTHTIQNTGQRDDTFAFLFPATTNLGYPISISQPSIFLPRGASAQILMTVEISSAAPAGAVSIFEVTARSVSDPNVSGKVTNTTTVQQLAGVDFSPSRLAPVAPARTVTFLHTLTNTGNGADGFTISATQDYTWTVTIVPTETAKLSRGGSVPVTVVVDIPPGTPPTTVNRIHLRASSGFDDSVQAQVTNTLSQFAARPSGLIYDVFLAGTHR